VWIDHDLIVNSAATGTRRPRILFLTGTRADFGKIKPLLQAVKDSSDFEYFVFATGLHMLARYGSTVMEIRKAGFENIFTFINQDGMESGMDLVLANTIKGLGYYIREFPPDLIVVHGDRVEALAGATVGALHNIRVAHIEGGEVSGTVDELLRHAVSKLSHIHFVSNEDARRRLVQMGEVEDSVFVIGAPNIDIMLSDSLPTLAEVKRRYEIDYSRYTILVYHPVTSEVASLRRNIEVVLDAVEESGRNFAVIYPNNDSGTQVILEAINRLRGNPRFTLIPSMRFEYYLTLLRNAEALVGNSSSGIHEAPVYGVPSVNIGTRQLNRFHYASIIDVPEEKEAILRALRTLPRSFTPTAHFGRGDSARRFLEHLESERLWTIRSQKQFQDVALASSPMM
jgi:UDP-N-acetylglucosamine 2-epimerase (hydrolysing)